MSTENQAGGCRCGAVRFETKGAPKWVAHCHCESCRKASGSGFATFVGFDDGNVTFTKEPPTIYESSPGMARSFCNKCGSPIFCSGGEWPDERHLFIGTFDEPDVFEPQGHIFPEERLHWAHLRDEVPDV